MTENKIFHKSHTNGSRKIIKLGVKSLSFLMALLLLAPSILIPTYAASDTYSYEIHYTITGDVSMRHGTFTTNSTYLELPRNPTNEQVLAAARSYVESHGQAPTGQIFDPSDSFAEGGRYDYVYNVQLSYYGTDIYVYSQIGILLDGSYLNYGSLSSSAICSFSKVKALSVSPNSGYYFNNALSKMPRTFPYGDITYIRNDANSQLQWGVNCGDVGWANICLFAVYDPSATVSYQYTGAVPAGVSTPGSVNATPGETRAVANVAAPGYSFSGWTSPDATVSSGTFIVPSKNVTFTGSWTPRTDTPYGVEFYLQNLTGTYEKQSADSISGKGTTDTQIRSALDMTALSTKYPHYHLSDSSKADTTSIAGNGTSILKLYYDLDTANVTYVYSGTIPAKAPALPSSTQQKYGATVPIATAPSLAGYDFSGWTSSDVIKSGNTFTMPATDVSMAGSWTPRTDTPYTVEYYQQNVDNDEYTLTNTEHCTGTTDTMAIPPQKTYQGFTMTPASVTASTNTNIDGDGSSILKLYYDRNVNAVTYAYSGDTDETPQAVPVAKSFRYGQTVTLAAAPSLTGYDFGGWETADATIADSSFIMPDGPVTLTGTWTPRSDTPYTVEYYQQNLNDDNYTKITADTVAAAGTTGADIASIPEIDKTYPGFTMTEASATNLSSTKIHSTGNTVLKLYYDRNINTVTYAYAGETDETPPVLPVAKSFRYGQTVTLATAPSLTGYDFDGWKTTDAPTAGGTFIMPDGPVTLTGTWTPRSDTPFVVEYYQQNLEDHDYSKVAADTYIGVGTTGAPIPQAHKEYEGFTETGSSVAAETGTKIASNGSTVLKLYYDRNSYAVTYAYTSGHVDGEPACPAELHYQYGATVTVEPAFSELTGYHFDGWSSNDVSLSSGTFTMPAKAVTITGAWVPNSDTPYVVEYYQQNLENDEYSLVSADTVHGHGTTMGTIPEAGKPEAEKTYPGFTMTAASAAEAGTAVIAPDGSTVLKLYYDRNVNLVTYVYTGQTPSDAPALPSATAYKFGQNITLPAAPVGKGNIHFSGWGTSDVVLSSGTFTMPDKPVTILGTWYDSSSEEDSKEYTATLISDNTPEEKLTPNFQNQVSLPAGPTKDGYTFVGWAESDGGMVSYQAGVTITLTKSMTFYAVYAKQQGAFIYGYRDGTFRPEDYLTTHQSQLMLARLMDTPEPDASTSTKEAISRKDFLTVVEQSTATSLIGNDVMKTAIESGWIQGYSDGSLQEDAYITRAQAVIILNRAFNRSDVQPDNAISYTDLPKGYWAHDQIIAASTKEMR